MGEIIGYARVSSREQNLEIQLEKLRAAGCQEIFQEKVSGTTANRPKLKECLRYVRKGDTLTITKIDRLARSLPDLFAIAKTLEDKEVDLKFLDQGIIDTSGPMGKLLFGVFGAFAQFETDIRAQRQQEGIEAAKERGVKFGKVKTLTTEQAQALWNQRKRGVLIKDLAQEYGFTNRTVYRYLKEAQANEQEETSHVP